MARSEHGWPAGFVLAQVPNAPLIVALASGAAAALTTGRVSGSAEALSRLALGVFAYLELTDGVNWFRRALGATVLVYLVYRLGGRLE